jgi:hypothetical protein
MGAQRRDGLRVRVWVDVLKHFGTLSGATAVGVPALQESLGLGGEKEAADAGTVG